MDLIIEQDVNLSNCFLLPLLKRSSKDFGTGNFINSYVDLESFQLVVEVTQAQSYFKDYTGFDYAVTKADSTLLFYDIPEVFHYDVALFVEGKYSQFSEGAKTYIRKYAKLPLTHKTDGTVQRSVWLHVIDKSDELRQKLEHQLGISLPREVELASKPAKSNFFKQ